MKATPLLWGGIIGPAAYVLATLLGGLFTPGYDHLRDSVSALTQSGAANKAWLDPIFLLYGLGLSAFGLGWLASVRASNSYNGQRFGMASGWLWLAVGFMSALITLFFPMDPLGSEATFSGTMHLVLVGVVTLSTVAAIFAAGLWLRTASGLKRYARYSFVSVAALLLSGFAPVLGIALGSPLVGLLERLPIAAFMQWLMVMRLVLAPGSVTLARSKLGRA